MLVILIHWLYPRLCYMSLLYHYWKIMSYMHIYINYRMYILIMQVIKFIFFNWFFIYGNVDTFFLCYILNESDYDMSYIDYMFGGFGGPSSNQGPEGGGSNNVPNPDPGNQPNGNNPLYVGVDLNRDHGQGEGYNTRDTGGEADDSMRDPYMNPVLPLENRSVTPDSISGRAGTLRDSLGVLSDDVLTQIRREPLNYTQAWEGAPKNFNKFGFTTGAGRHTPGQLDRSLTQTEASDEWARDQQTGNFYDSPVSTLQNNLYHNNLCNSSRLGYNPQAEPHLPRKESLNAYLRDFGFGRPRTVLMPWKDEMVEVEVRYKFLPSRGQRDITVDHNQRPRRPIRPTFGDDQNR